MGKKYKNPPIIEAFCEFQFEANSPWDLAVPGLLYEKIRKTFPKRREALRINLGISASAGALSQELGTSPLIQFLREDEKALVQVGQHLLAINHLKPYPTWAEFFPMIVQALQAYRDTTAPKSIHRIGLRYINRIEIPGGRIQLEDYLEFYPFLGSKLPQDLAEFLMGVLTPVENTRDALRLQLSRINAATPNVLALLLDIDYFLTKPGAITLEDVAQWVTLAHEHVEQVFENSIKDSLRDLFQEVKE